MVSGDEHVYTCTSCNTPLYFHMMRLQWIHHQRDSTCTTIEVEGHTVKHTD